ncbi:hypothetical protein G6321_00042610 [Bradyrhizobium barranii subsp. barranii]|uniref:Uncharacterized protein n=1 Tax=Bradyrhizobium barranii subsp. barranii TaxID=2823807 RepID=A0A7Z0QE04_9BRAD|nr:hypothetical protein [Bradyrhizobium barranii]UGX92340.1 hypothetical protein G6321_00042610 [Bradyrhizobium barranii subsp. barranii]
MHATRAGTDREQWSTPATYPIALALLLLLRDSVEKTTDWHTVIDFAAGLLKKFRNEREI